MSRPQINFFTPLEINLESSRKSPGWRNLFRSSVDPRGFRQVGAKGKIIPFALGPTGGHKEGEQTMSIRGRSNSMPSWHGGAVT